MQCNFIEHINSHSLTGPTQSTRQLTIRNNMLVTLIYMYRPNIARKDREHYQWSL